MSDKYKPGQIIKNVKEPTKLMCCLHKNIVPLEFGFASVTYPNGYTAEPYYNFAITSVSATVIRVKTYLCLECKMEIRAPDPGTLKKDRI